MDEQIIGQNIRALRTAAGVSLSQAAREADLSKGALSKIETGQISPPISTLVRIAKALGVPLVEFFAEEDTPPAYVLTRKGKGNIIPRDGSQFGYSYAALAIDKRDKLVEPFLLTIGPDDPVGTFQHSGQEFIHMLSGKIEFTVGDESFVLQSGDSLYFDSDTIHKTKLVGKRPAQFLCLFIQPTPAKRRKDKPT